MLLAISSQISILLAGLQRLEGQQRHPQPPPPPPVPDGQPPPPPPPSTTPSSMPATSVRPDYPTAPVTLVATSDNRMEHTAHVHTVSVSTSRERRRRRRSRHRIGVGLAAAVTIGVLLAALPTLVPRPTVAPSLQSTHRQSRPRRRAGHLVSHMTVDGPPAAKGPHHIDVRMFC